MHRQLDAITANMSDDGLRILLGTAREISAIEEKRNTAGKEN